MNETDDQQLWCSIDPANVSGVAYWHGKQLVNTKVVRKVGNKGHYSVGAVKLDNQWHAWDEAINTHETVVVEEGFGRFATAVKAQGFLRGFIFAVCMCKNIDRPPCKMIVVNVKEWRRAISEAYGVSWPATTERKKALSVQIVKTHFGMDLTNDEADAVLLGVAAMRMGLVNG